MECFSIAPQTTLVDQDVIIRMNGLIPNETITLRTETSDATGCIFHSWGTYRVDKEGLLDLSRQAPIAGAYQGVDPMGLFWTMKPKNGSEGISFQLPKVSFSVTLTAHRGEQELASHEINRLCKAPDVHTIVVEEDGLKALLFLPPSDTPLKVIISLGGSGGGYGSHKAQLLASHGFAVLALAYFGVDSLSSNLQDIPIEYFEKALAWIKRQPALDSSNVSLYGTSRGAELSLLLGSLFPHAFASIVAVVPSSVINSGFSDKPIHAWLYNNTSLSPFAPVATIDCTNYGHTPENPIHATQSFIEGMKAHPQAFSDASIYVERIRSPLLLISGGDDQMWPSMMYANQIQERLKKKQSAISCEHLSYPKAGHIITFPNIPHSSPLLYHPICKLWFSVGGSPEEDEKACRDSWSKLLHFLKKT